MDTFIGVVFVKRAFSWQVYIKSNKTKLNNKDTSINKEEWFPTEMEARKRLEELSMTR